jgi:hypothetical protein
MNYPDGQDIKLGDIVDLGGGMEGVVVIDVENREFTDRFDMSVVLFLESGIMIDTNNIGLLHLPANHDHYIKLIRRK